MTGIEEAAAALWASYGETVVASAATAGTAAAVTSAMQKPLPGVKPPVPMPDQQSTDDARRRSMAAQLARRGRASTILTDPGDTLG